MGADLRLIPLINTDYWCERATQFCQRSCVTNEYQKSGDLWQEDTHSLLVIKLKGPQWPEQMSYEKNDGCVYGVPIVWYDTDFWLFFKVWRGGFFSFSKSLCHIKRSTPTLLLLWQRLRTVGIFRHDATHIRCCAYLFFKHFNILFIDVHLFRLLLNDTLPELNIQNEI